jgi:hypothetical protein
MDRVSVWNDEKKLLEMSSDDGCILGMYLMPVNYTLKMVKSADFILYILSEFNIPPLGENVLRTRTESGNCC